MRPEEKAAKWLKEPHFGGVKSEGAIDIINELITEIDRLGEVLRGRTDVIAEWMEKCESIKKETAAECVSLANDFPLYGYAGQEVADAIKEKFGLEI